MPRGYSTIRTTYQEVARRAEVKGPCVICGKSAKRAYTATATINPWNRDPDTGEPRTYQQVWESLGPRVKEWKEATEAKLTHVKCES